MLQQANVAHLYAVRKLVTWWNKKPLTNSVLFSSSILGLGDDEEICEKDEESVLGLKACLQ